MSPYEAEEEALQRAYDEGKISLKELNQELMDLQHQCRDESRQRYMDDERRSHFGSDFGL